VNDYKRDPQGFRFQFGGMKTATRPDALPTGKYPYVLNVRSYTDDTIRTRPGLSQLFKSSASATLYPFLDMRAYTALFSATARLLAVDGNSKVWLDNGTQVGMLAGGTSPLGSALLPFRPGASPAPWMYIANGLDYQKFSAPSATNAVIQQKVGIAEPQTAPEAAVTNVNALQSYLGDPSTAAGTISSSTTGTRTTDTIVAVLPVDTAISGTTFFSLQVHSRVPYQRFQTLFDSTQSNSQMRIYDVFQPTASATTIQGIFYFSGTTGKCVIVPASFAAGIGNEEQSLYGQNLLSSLRRGSLVSIGGEICLVQSVSTGPNGSISFETSTTAMHSTSDTITVVPAIMVSAPGFTPAAGDTITSTYRSYTVGAGIGTMTLSGGGGFITNLTPFQPDDYIHISLLLGSAPASLTEMKILLDVGDGSFTQNFYYYTIRPSDILAAVNNGQTQLAAVQAVTQRAIIDEETAAAANNQGVTASSAQAVAGENQWSEFMIPISEFTRVGDDQTLSLQYIVAMQFLFNANGSVFVEHGVSDNWVLGGGQLDVGPNGAPYMYRVRPRSSLTGVVGNPSPATRYGVNPRRQSVTISLPSAAYDSQIDTWDVFRYGGSVTEWRFIGSTPSTNATFQDNFDDAAAEAGDALDFDNFEPWPSIDVPNNGLTGTGGTGQIGIVGTIGALTSFDQDISAYLPGTLIQVGGGNVYTFWTRPVQIGANVFLVQFVENAGVYPVFTNYIIQEPAIANQHLPYMWGPDASGTVFACGDPLRPGSIYFSKNYAPDSAPDSFNQEISQPSEPLVGGETIDGLSYVASPERWWALYPQPQDTAQRYSVVQQPFTRGLAAPYGHCNDGKALYWWAKDGIYSSDKGPLTDDLYNLFPHDGEVGENVTYNGATVWAPDYTRANTFRLAYSLGYLYAIYQDVNGIYRNLVLDLRRMAWSVDQYATPATAVYHLEQSPQPNSGVTLMAISGGTTGALYAIAAQQKALTNDISTPISSILASNEFDGGDIRAPKQWGDLFLDCLPAAPAGILATPMSFGALVTASTTVPTSATRQRVPISTSFSNPAVSDFMGVMLSWTDDYTKQSTQTRLFAWQPSYIIQPARAIAWSTLGSAFGIDGYMHIRQIAIAYISTAQVIVGIVSYDGQSPAPISLPSTNGNYRKTLFPVSANKGMLFQFIVFSPTNSPFQIFLDDSEIYVGAWGRSGPYIMPQKFGGNYVDASPV
jgi:hypothetical protein